MLEDTQTKNLAIVIQAMVTMQTELELLSKQFDLLNEKVNIVCQFLNLKDPPQS